MHCLLGCHLSLASTPPSTPSSSTSSSGHPDTTPWVSQGTVCCQGNGGEGERMRGMRLYLWHSVAMSMSKWVEGPFFCLHFTPPRRQLAKPEPKCHGHTNQVARCLLSQRGPSWMPSAHLGLLSCVFPGPFAVISVMIGSLTDSLVPSDDFLEFVNGTNVTVVNEAQRDAARVELVATITVLTGIFQVRT